MKEFINQLLNALVAAILLTLISILLGACSRICMDLFLFGWRAMP
jgi:hypothetical protein